MVLMALMALMALKELTVPRGLKDQQVLQDQQALTALQGLKDQQVPQVLQDPQVQVQFLQQDFHGRARGSPTTRAEEVQILYSSNFLSLQTTMLRTVQVGLEALKQGLRFLMMPARTEVQDRIPTPQRE
tara:strand:+ start:1476 stop:1862 length:387 start_codon:yes stop_codon:yes gene_type:complete